MSRVFITYSSRDRRQAIALKRWLTEREPGLAREIFLDVDADTGLPLGIRWKDALRKAKDRCEAVIVLLSSAWESSHECKLEYRHAEDLNKPVFVVRLEPMESGEITREWQRCDLFGDGPQTEASLGDGSEPVVFLTDGLERLRTGLRATGVGAEYFPWPPPGDPNRAPYRGWEPFEEVDAAVYFGRDAQILDGLDRLRGIRNTGVESLFVILGPSGVGKSSFLRAGLLPRLRRDDRNYLPLDIVRPERNALTGDSGLAQSIHAMRVRLGLTRPTLGEIKAACPDGVERLREWLLEAQQAARARVLDLPPDAPAPALVLPVDQAEELFGVDAGAQARQLLSLLARLMRDANGDRVSMFVVLTIRADLYEAWQTAPELAGLKSAVFGELKPMPPTQFKEVVVGPVRRAGETGRQLRVEPALVDRLLEECGQGADTLPLLSLTLSRLYRDYGGDIDLTLVEYTAMGGMSRVVQTEIDSALSADPGERQRQLERLRRAFIPWLATINPDNDQPMRRVARWSDIPAESRPLIDVLVAKRLLVKDERGGETVVEVALESLLRQWDELAEWLRSEAEDLKAADRLEGAATEWERRDRDEDWLLQGTRLEDAEVLSAKTDFIDRLQPTRGFLLASRERETARTEEEKRRREAELQAAKDKQQAAEALAEAETEAKEQAQAHTAALRQRTRVLRAALAVTLVAAMVAVFYYFQERDSARESLAAQLNSEAQAMLAGARPEGEFRALGELLAAPHIAPNTDADAMLGALVARRDVVKIIGTPDLVGSAAFDRDGNRIVSGGSDGMVRLWNAHTGQPEGAPMLADRGGVSNVAFSPDGGTIAAGGSDGVVRLWETATQKPLNTPDITDPSAVLGMGFKADGGRIVSATFDGTLRWWETTTGKLDSDPVERLRGGRVMSVAFSPDGRWLALGSEDNSIRLADLSTPEYTLVDEVLAGHQGVAHSIAFSPNSGQIASGSADGTVRLWDAHSHTSIGAPMEGHEAPVTSVAFSPDGQRIISGDLAGTIRVWDVATGHPASTPLVGHRGMVTSVGFSRDGSRLLSASADTTMRIWDANTAVGMTGHSGGGLGVYSVRFNEDGNRISSASLDGARLWDADTGTSAGFMAGQGFPVAVAWSRDWQMVVIGGKDGTLLRWDSSGLPLGDPITSPGLASLDVSYDGRWIVTGGEDGAVRRWDARTGKKVSEQLDAHTARVNLVGFSPDSRMVVTGSLDRTLRRWDAATGKSLGEPMTVNPKAPAVSADFSPDGRTLATGDDVGTVRRWDAGSGQALGEPMTGHKGSIYVEYSPDGRTIASYGFDATVRRWDAQTGELLGEMPTQGWTANIDFSPDSRRLASAGADGIRLWNADTGEPIGEPMRGHIGQALSVDFSPDGRSIVSGGADHTVRLWSVPPLDPTEWPKALCDKLTRNMSKSEWNAWVSPDADYAATCPDLPVPDDRTG
ncbi:TIR domain-containing protein [Rhodococcus sp. MTM3W5.2]|uniref:nSTAND1 domain-containing NTPase n=1 Tax=Rhodococcus sp. MTM3W5.2 TaxID=1805827 RepID=UPI00097C849F|nr:TIR domain-containing protein [Rhodococcus sp. MTM3W5.2]